MGPKWVRLNEPILLEKTPEMIELPVSIIETHYSTNRWLPCERVSITDVVSLA